MAWFTRILLCISIHLLIISISFGLAQDKNDLCDLTQCSPFNKTTSDLTGECKGEIKERCCYEGVNNTEVVGIDLSSCQLKEINIFQDNYVNTTGYSSSKLQILILSDNPFSNYTDDDFENMPALGYLALPPELQCPGGDEGWKDVNNEHNQTLCKGQVDVCQEKNVTCPKQSHCEMFSPGVTQCLCDKGFYGYKCLRTGYFSWAGFLSGIIGGTAIVSVSLWAVFRRKVKKQ